MEGMNNQHIAPLLSCLLLLKSVSAFMVHEGTPRVKTYIQSVENNKSEQLFSRRETLSHLIGGTAIAIASPAGALINPFLSIDEQPFEPAKRSTCYLVDSTIPPSLIPHKRAREAAILKQIGAGLGTPKTPKIDDAITLNNIMNKALKNGMGLAGIEDGSVKRKATTSFVFLGVDCADQVDAGLTTTLMGDIMKPRRNLATAFGLAFAPLSTQPALDSFLKSGDEGMLLEALKAAGVDPAVAVTQLSGPIKFAKQKGLELVALAPELEDRKAVREQGLQNLDPQRRGSYVVDAQGFIDVTQDPRFKLYTEKSMMKNFTPLNESDSAANFFAESILADEAIASAAARWSVLRPESLIAIVAPIQDVRFYGGASSRVERICKFLSPDTTIDDESITTILLNPSAEVSRTLAL